MVPVALGIARRGQSFRHFFIELAKNDMRQWMINLPDKDLAYLPQGTEHFEDYVRAVHWAQDYALANRELMMQNMIAAVKSSGEVPTFEANVESCQLPSQLRDVGTPLRRKRSHHAQGGSTCA